MTKMDWAFNPQVLFCNEPGPVARAGMSSRRWLCLPELLEIYSGRAAASPLEERCLHDHRTVRYLLPRRIESYERMRIGRKRQVRPPKTVAQVGVNVIDVPIGKWYPDVRCGEQ